MAAKVSIKTGEFIDQKNRKIVFTSYVIKKAVAQVYIVHGFSEHTSCYRETIDYLTGKKISCHIMDLPGHGNSEGIRGHIDQFQDYTDNLRVFIKSNPGHDSGCDTFILGHSLGGAIAHQYTLHPDIAVKGLILVSPLFGLPISNKPFSFLFRFLSRKDKSLLFPKPSFISTLNRTPSKINYYKTDPLRLQCLSPNLYLELEKANKENLSTAPDQKTPLIIFASAKDKVVSYDTITKFFKRAGSLDKKMISFSDAMHELLQEAENMEILDIIQHWIKSRS